VRGRNANGEVQEGARWAPSCVQQKQRAVTYLTDAFTTGLLLPRGSDGAYRA